MKSDRDGFNPELDLGVQLNRELEAEGISVSEDLLTRTLAAAGKDNTTHGEALPFAAMRQKHRIHRLAYSLGSIAAAVLIICVAIKAAQVMMLKGNSSDEMLYYATSGSTDNGFESACDSDNETDYINSACDTAVPTDSNSMKTEKNEIEEMDDCYGLMGSEALSEAWYMNYTTTNLQEAADASVNNAVELVRLNNAYLELLYEESDSLATGNYALSALPCENVVSEALDLSGLTEIFEQTEEEAKGQEINSNKATDTTDRAEESVMVYRFICLTASHDVNCYIVSSDGSISTSEYSEENGFVGTGAYIVQDSETLFHKIDMWLKEHDL